MEEDNIERVKGEMPGDHAGGCLLDETEETQPPGFLVILSSLLYRLVVIYGEIGRPWSLLT